MTTTTVSSPMGHNDSFQVHLAPEPLPDRSDTRSPCRTTISHFDDSSDDEPSNESDDNTPLPALLDGFWRRKNVQATLIELYGSHTDPWNINPKKNYLLKAVRRLVDHIFPDEDFVIKKKSQVYKKVRYYLLLLCHHL